MRRVEFRQPASPGQLFAATAFDNEVGKVIPFRVGANSEYTVPARIARVDVEPTGRGVHSALEVMDGLRFSFGGRSDGAISEAQFRDKIM